MNDREILELLRHLDRKIDVLQAEVRVLATIVLEDRTYLRTVAIGVASGASP